MKLNKKLGIFKSKNTIDNDFFKKLYTFFLINILLAVLMISIIIIRDNEEIVSNYKEIEVISNENLESVKDNKLLINIENRGSGKYYIFKNKNTNKKMGVDIEDLKILINNSDKKINTYTFGIKCPNDIDYFKRKECDNIKVLSINSNSIIKKK